MIIGGPHPVDKELWEACAQGDAEAAADCLRRGATARRSAWHPDLPPPLTAAARSGSVDCARLLLSQPGADPDLPERDGMTALMHAASQGDEAMVALLAPLSNLELFDAGRRTALARAAEAGSLACVKILAAATPWPKAPYPSTPTTQALLAAAQAGSAQCAAEILRSFPPCAGETDSRGRSALMLAAQGGHAECVKALLPHSDPDYACSLHYSETALMMAAAAGMEGSVEALLAATRPAADTLGMTALMKAAERGHAGCVRLLIGRDDPMAVDRHGFDALTHAVQSALNFSDPAMRAEAAKALAPVSDLSRRVPLEGRSSKACAHPGLTAWEIAAAEGSRPMVEALLPFVAERRRKLPRLARKLAESALFGGRAPSGIRERLRLALGRALAPRAPLLAAIGIAKEAGKPDVEAAVRASELSLRESEELASISGAPRRQAERGAEARKRRL